MIANTFANGAAFAFVMMFAAIFAGGMIAKATETLNLKNGNR